MMDELRGIFSALITPMKHDETVDLAMLTKIVELQITQGVEGFYCCGSSGESLLLSIDERKTITRSVLEAVADRVPVIAHVGTLRTADTVVLATDAMAAGASAISMIPPYYYKFTHDEILGYYTDVMCSTNAPVIIYNVPQFTGISFTKDNAALLLSDPRLIGVKHTSTDLYALERMKNTYPDKVYFNGFDEMYLSALAVGADAAIGTTVNLFAKRFRNIRQLFNEGRLKEAASEQSRINKAVEVFVRHGIFNAVKFVLNESGYNCGECRAPFKALNESGKKEIRQLMEELGS